MTAPPFDPTAFRDHLVAHEAHTPESAQRHLHAIQTHAIDRVALPLDFASVVAIQDAWLALRRFLHHQGADPGAFGWLPLRPWVAHHSAPDRRFVRLDPVRTQRVILLRPRGESVHSRCLTCQEEEVLRCDGQPTLTDGRAAAFLQARIHDGLSSFSGAWCEDVALGSADFGIWLVPPAPRPWAEEQEDWTAFNGGDVAPELADMELAIRDAEDPDDWDLYSSGGGGCSCGYMSVSGPGGGDCPCCGPAGMG